MSEFRAQRANGGDGEARTLVCRGRPDSILAGRSSAFVGTTLGEWFVVRSENDVTPLPRLESHATAQLAGETVAVALFEPMIALLEGEEWRYVTCEAPVLAMTRHNDALIVGDAHGNLARVGLHGDHEPPLAIGRGPIVDVVTRGSFIAFVDGHLGTVKTQEDRSPVVTYVDAGSLGRPFRFFPMHDRRIGVAGATKLAALDPEMNELGACSAPFGGGIRHVVALRGGGDYAVVTDDGELWLVDSAWERRSVRLPQTSGDVVGAAPLQDGGLLAWTTAGQLFRKNRRGATTLERRADVALASTFRDLTLSVEWQAGSGARFDFLWSRDN